MKELSLKEIQKQSFDMLCVFKKICEKNNLYYTLAGGTLLGAIRHKGFIPWDDDIDVLMPRPDYERLLNMHNLDLSMLPDYMKLSNWRNDEGEGFPFIKLLNTHIHVEDEYSHGDQYIWIDIHPIDGCPENDEELKRYFRKIKRRKRIILIKIAKMGKGKTRLKKFIKPFVIMILSPFSVKHLCDWYDKYARRYAFETSKYIGCTLWGYGPQERIEKEGYLQPVKVQFEGEEFNGPSNFDAYLSGLYGEYMKLPPEEKRRTRHDIIVYSEE